MSITLPVRVFPVYAGQSVDDDDKRTLVTCRDASDAEAIVRKLEAIKRAKGFIPHDASVHFFQSASDVDLELDVAGVSDAIAQGFIVRSVVIITADVPASGVLATIAGSNAADAPPPDPADVGKLSTAGR